MLPASPLTVADYIAAHADVYKPATLDRRLAAISVAHKSAGYDSPTGNIAVRGTLRGIKRAMGTAQNKKAPVRRANLRQATAELPDTLQGKRDRALLLLGYIGALRRSELVALDVADIAFTAEGMRLVIRRSKTDQEATGVVMGIDSGTYTPTCPVRALREWLDCSGIDSGPIFRPINRHGQLLSSRLSGTAVGLIIKRLAPSLGVDPAAVGGHSLRAGFVTDAYSAGVAEAVIMERSRHKTHSVMAGYRREANLFAVNYTAAVGL